MKSHTVIAAAITLLTLAGSVAGADVSIDRSELANGVRILVVYVPDAPKQTIFTFIPVTMINDDAHHAQWAHLLEHMLIRSTDPLDLSVPGMMLNGETMHTYMRLEIFAEPDQWKPALERHSKWLAARQFDAQTLEREKGHIQSEEQNTAQGGFTSKFALAAWNQVVRHHLKQAAVHGDVAGADLAQVEAYAQAKLPMDGSVMIATIGPAPIPEMKQEMQRLAGALPKHAVSAPAGADAKAEFSGPLQASWDFPTRHAMWWWKLPSTAPNARAAAACIARAVQMQLLMAPEHRNLIRQALVYPNVETPEGSFFIVDCCLVAAAPDTEGADQSAAPEKAFALIKPLIEGLGQGKTRHGTIAWCGRMLLQELNPKPNFELLRKQTPAAMRDLAEGNWLLAQMNYEYSWGIPAGEVANALETLDESAVKAVLEPLSGEPAGSLLLEPEVHGDASGQTHPPNAPAGPATAPH